MVMRGLKLCLLLVLAVSVVASQAAELKAIPDRTRVGLEESFTLELRVIGSVDGEPDLSVLERDFEVLGRSQSSQIQIVNGEINRTASWRIALLPRGAGRKQIPPLCIDGECSDSVAIEVLPGGQKQGSMAGGQDLLLEVSAEPERVYVQAQLLYRVRILTRLNILQAAIGDPQPTGVEAVVQQLGEDRQYETRRDGVLYRAIERLYAIFPQQSGTLTIPPLRLDAQVSAGGRRSFDPFGRESRQLRRRSEELSLEVLPAEDAAGRSWLPATELRLTDDWQSRPPQLTVGEPATRTLTLQAVGLPAAQLPQLELSVPAEFKSYPDQPNRHEQIGAQGIVGSLEQKLALVPTRPGRFRLPEISIEWWDLTAERWRQARLPEVEVEVLAAAEQPAVVIPPPVQPQMEVPAETAPVGVPLAPVDDSARFWPWLSLALGLGWLLTLVLLLRVYAVQRRAERVAATEQQTQPCLKAARRDLFRVLPERDPVQVRAALLAWGEALDPVARPVNLEQLAELCGDPLAQQLEAFSRCCYSRSAGDWDAETLRNAVMQVERQRAAKPVRELPSFYPG